MNSVRPLLAFGSLLLLTSCQHFQSQPIDPARTAARLDQRSLSDPQLLAFVSRTPAVALTSSTNAPAPVDWNLDNLTRAALFFRTELKQAQLQAELAGAEIRTAQGRPNPSITITPGSSLNPPPATPPWIPLGTFDLPIETAGKRRYRTAAAQHHAEAAQLNILSVAWTIRSQVRTALIDRASALARTSLLTNEISIQQQIHQRISQRIQAGALPASDLALIQAALSKAHLDLATAGFDQIQSLSRLAQAVGIPRSALEQAEIDFPIIPIPIPDSPHLSALRDVALRQRADLRQALAAYAESQASLQLQIAKQYPDLHLSPGYQWDEGEHKWQLGISLELPLLNRNQGPIAEAQSKRRQAAAQVELLQMEILHSIDEAIAQSQSAQNQLAQSQQLLAAQHNQLRALQEQLAAGAADPLDLLTLQLQQLQAEQLQLESRIRLQSAAASLESALQSGSFQLSPQDLRQTRSSDTFLER